MKNVLLLLISLFISVSFLKAQHLPHKLENQWHYDVTTVPGGLNYAAVVTERVVVNGLNYWKIDRYHAQTGELIETMYDRMEGDSLYIRKVACPEELIINFNWPLGHIEVTALGSDCYNFKKLISKSSRDVFGINTISYKFMLGNFCEGYTDTIWVLFTPEITKELGCFWGNDGRLVGAVINGTTYGTLYPLPVELLSFNAYQINNKSVSLKWKTASEINNAGYAILKKKYEAKEWEKISYVEGKGTTTEQQEYSFTDNEIAEGTWFYRIIQYDYDGTSKLIGETPLDIIITPEVFTLKQNYPNPFNPSTVIEYVLSSTESVKLKVFDIMGREITTLVNESQSAGTYKYFFPGDHLSSGIYIYTLQAGNIIETRQMLLMK